VLDHDNLGWRDGERVSTRVRRTALRYTFPQELAALPHY
jgi:hypothetical protein